MAKKPPGDNAPISPWLKGTNVRGGVPPGRRLGALYERRVNRWSASGVSGVTPPGNQRPGTGPAAQWMERSEKRDKQKTLKANQLLMEAKKASKTIDLGDFDAMRPMAGFVPDVFDDLDDPDDLKAFLKQITDFISENRPSPETAENFKEFITQSHAPYEIIVAFTILSAIIGQSSALRRRYTMALERGAKVFFNLAMRLNPSVQPPRGLSPESSNSLFYDLPDSAYQVPYAFGTDAFCRMIELIRQDEEGYDQALVEFTMALRQRFVERRSLGDQPLKRMFPWEAPEWAHWMDSSPY